MTRHDVARSLLRAIYSTGLTSCPIHQAKTLTIRLHPLASQSSDNTHQTSLRSAQQKPKHYSRNRAAPDLRIGLGLNSLKARYHEIWRSELVADPGFAEPLAVAFDTDAHWVGNPARISSSDCVRCCSMRIVAAWEATLHPCHRTPTLALGRRRRWQVVGGSAAGFFTRFDLRGIARDMTDDMIPEMTTDELFMHPFREVLRGELGEGTPRRLPAPGNLGAALPAAYAVAVHDRPADARSGPMWWGW